MLGGEMLTTSAIERRLQWVAFGGLSHTMLATTYCRASGTKAAPGRAGFVALKPNRTSVEITLQTAPDGRLRRLRSPQDLKRAVAV